MNKFGNNLYNKEIPPNNNDANSPNKNSTWNHSVRLNNEKV
jgi:hypothetical protein